LTEIVGDFKPNTKTVRELFDGTNYYKIPDYQRPYEWGEDEIGLLWDDVFAAFEAKDKLYFLGPLILAKNDSDELEVIDGQQRLTTLTILFSVLRDYQFKNLDSKDSLKRQVANAVKSAVDEKYRLILITQAHYQNQFKEEVLEKVILPTNALTKKEKAQHKWKFANAASILKSSIDALNKRQGEAKVKDFVKYLLGNVVMITITCSNRVSAIKLFQTLNTRGLELSLADLTKSILLSRLNTDQERKQFTTSWQDIERIMEDNGESVTDLLTYYRHFLIAGKPKKSLYEELEANFKNKDSNQVVYQLKKFVQFYDEIISKKSKDIEALKLLPDTVFWKTILITAKMKDYQSFPKLCEELKRLYYSYWLANYTTTKTRNFSFLLIKQIKKGEPIVKIQNQISKKFAIDSVMEWVRKNLDADAYPYSWAKPLLLLIERAQTDESVIIECGRNLHIDHILPEEWEKKVGWRKNWEKPDADLWLSRIGNLTLLSGKKNIQASNNEFEIKKTIYKGKGIDGVTGFEISKRILINSNWTLKEVKKRHKWLLTETQRILNIEF
jgi:uncharacterized protein with ParB-like and HNH nuclease domain